MQQHLFDYFSSESTIAIVTFLLHPKIAARNMHSK